MAVLKGEEGPVLGHCRIAAGRYGSIGQVIATGQGAASAGGERTALYPELQRVSRSASDEPSVERQLSIPGEF